MKMLIEYQTTAKAVIEIPKELEFYFTKDEDDYTDSEWEKFDNMGILLYKKNKDKLPNFLDTTDWDFVKEVK